MWQWKQANGALRDMVCRGLLLLLHRAGEIQLPARRCGLSRDWAEWERPEPLVPDNRPVRGPLGDLLPLEFRQVRRTEQEALFVSLIEQYHYLRYQQPVGEHLKYLVSAKGQVIACLAWSSAVRHLASRDRFIGWSAEVRKRNLHLLAYNTRFLILPWVEVPHVASHILGHMTKLVALFFTGWKHAGENLATVLKQRARELAAPVQMCDALSRNTPKLEGIKTLLANCLAHGRRQFVAVAENFPEECRYVLEILRAVYHNDALTREQNLSAEERLHFHREHSRPLLTNLHDWMEAQFAERKTEPNSGLGKAIAYLLNHWKKLTLFLKYPGVPIDNNIVERALKKAILNRKNALFYKTLNGARVGDLFMSLIHTCELNGDGQSRRNRE